MNKAQFITAMKVAGKIRRKLAEDAFLLAFGFGLQGGYTRPLGKLIVRAAKRLAKYDGLSAGELKKVVSIAKKAGK